LVLRHSQSRRSTVPGPSETANHSACEQKVVPATLPLGRPRAGATAAQLAAVAAVGTQGNVTASPCEQGDLCPVGLCLVRVTHAGLYPARCM